MSPDLTAEEAFRVARRHLEERAAKGDLAAMYDKWLRILVVAGREYESGIATEDGRHAAAAMLEAIVSTSAMIPAEDQNGPAVKLFAALASIIATAWHLPVAAE